jgi:hypothetical protein
MCGRVARCITFNSGTVMHGMPLLPFSALLLAVPACFLPGLC